MPNATPRIKFTERVARLLGILALVVIFLLGLIGLGIGYGLNATQPLQAGFALGISSSLIGYVLTSGFHTWVVDFVRKQVLEETLRIQVREVVADVQMEAYGQMARQFPKLLPSAYYPPSNTSNSDFEAELGEGLFASRNYVFRGVTARHVPVFLKRVKPPNLHANVLALHPQETQQLMLYVMDRFGSTGMGIRDRRALLARVQAEMYSSIVGLFDAADVCPITIHLHRGPVFYRTELLDDRCYVAYYVGPRTTYALSYRYEKSTFFYEAFYKDALHLLQMDLPKIEFNASTGEAELEDFLKSIGCQTSVATLRDQFTTFETEFNSNRPGGR